MDIQEHGRAIPDPEDRDDENQDDEDSDSGDEELYLEEMWGDEPPGSPPSDLRESGGSDGESERVGFYEEDEDDPDFDFDNPDPDNWDERISASRLGYGPRSEWVERWEPDRHAPASDGKPVVPAEPDLVQTEGRETRASISDGTLLQYAYDQHANSAYVLVTPAGGQTKDEVLAIATSRLAEHGIGVLRFGRSQFPSRSDRKQYEYFLRIARTRAGFPSAPVVHEALAPRIPAGHLPLPRSRLGAETPPGASRPAESGAGAINGPIKECLVLQADKERDRSAEGAPAGDMEYWRGEAERLKELVSTLIIHVGEVQSAQAAIRRALRLRKALMKRLRARATPEQSAEQTSEALASTQEELRKSNEINDELVRQLRIQDDNVTALSSIRAGAAHAVRPEQGEGSRQLAEPVDGALLLKRLLPSLFPRLHLLRDSTDVLFQELKWESWLEALLMLNHGGFRPESGYIKKNERVEGVGKKHWREIRVRGSEDGRMYHISRNGRSEVLISTKPEQDRDIQWLKRH